MITIEKILEHGFRKAAMGLYLRAEGKYKFFVEFLGNGGVSVSVYEKDMIPTACIDVNDMKQLKYLFNAITGKPLTEPCPKP